MPLHPAIFLYKKRFLKDMTVLRSKESLSLDIFEGDLYQRTPILVETEGKEILNAETYVIKPEYRDYLSSKGWDVNKFTKTYLETFLESYQGFPKNS